MKDRVQIVFRKNIRPILICKDITKGKKPRVKVFRMNVLN